MAKHLIKIESTAHGVLGVRHAGKDQQYCEAGEQVILNWQPDAGWGLQEAHYTDGGGNIVPVNLTPVKIDGRDAVVFTMPDNNIKVGGTFKRFVIQDWTSKDGAFNILGSFDVANLPTLDGFGDAGKMAFVKDTRKYAYWDGYGWTYMDGNPVTPRYLTFTANEDGVELAFFFNRSNASEEQENPNISFQKSTDGGLTWEEHTIGVYDPEDGDTSDLDIISLDEGESVMFKGVNSENFTVGDPENGEGVYVGFYLDGSAIASGDITSIINGVGSDATIQFMQFYYMFYGCTGLTSAPALPATTLAEYCYQSMFSGCTGLTSAPSLPVTTLAAGCYSSMFQDCTGLTSAPALPATTLAEGCYNGMFIDCTGLISAPSLPATTLASNCYSSMFYGCTGMTSHDIMMLNTSSNIFYGNSSCTSLTIHAETPPTIESNTITGLKADCAIYVPAASVDAYKAAQYWSARAAYIQAMP